MLNSFLGRATTQLRVGQLDKCVDIQMISLDSFIQSLNSFSYELMSPDELEVVGQIFLSEINNEALVAAMNAGERGILWWSMSVVIIVMIIPVIVLAVILQRYISKGLLLGAVKG